MLPLSGLFADIGCPFLKRGLCERPHCLYKHAKEVRDMFGASYKSSVVDFAGVQHVYPSAASGPPVNAETKDDCLQQLERINKEIETVRHEVEKEQRRLSRYQTVQVDGRKTLSKFSVPKPETAGKNVDGDYYRPSSHTDFSKSNSLARKYVVDNSKPRTDLEYDPLSNFSAGLRSYSSSGKDQKARSGQGVKRARDSVCSDQKKPVVRQAQVARSPSPELLDDSKEEGVLVIDIPPSPDKKRSRAQKPCEAAASKPQDITEEAKEVKPADSPPPRPANPEVFKAKSPPEANKVNNNNCAEHTPEPSNFSVSQECESKPIIVSVFDDLSRCLEDLRSESQRISCFQAADPVVENGFEPESFPRTSDSLEDHHCKDLLVEEVSSFAAELPEKMHPMQPHDVSQKATFPHRNPAANSFSLSHNHTSQAQKTEQPVQYVVHDHWSPVPSVPSGPPYVQKTSSQMPGQMQRIPAVNRASPASRLERAEAASGSSQCQAPHASSTSVNSRLTNGVDSPSAATEQLSVKASSEEVIIIDSSEEAELNYSEVDMSDSDPMEECYRIFMEANREEKGVSEPPDVPVGTADVETPELHVKPQALSGQKRVAHGAKHTEQPVAKSRSQPQVLVPLRGPAAPGPASQLSITPKIQQVQHRASMLTASVRGGQAFISSAPQRKAETRVAAPLPPQTPANKPVTIQNSYMNCIPVGATMIEVGDNLHLILPEGAYPLPITSITGPVTSVLTPIAPVHTSPVTPIHVYHPASVAPVHRYRPTLPVPVPPMPTKRKMKQRSEGAKDKVPHDVRQRYVNMFTEEFLKTSPTVKDAFEKALAEERTVYNRSVNKLKYLSVAVNALKKLKNQSAVAAKDENEVSSQRSKGNIPLSFTKLKGNGDAALYESLKEHVLTEEMLIESNFPLKHPEKPDSAALFADNKKGTTDPLKRICCRCGATYSVSQTGKHTRKEECNYHYGKGVENKVPGGVETRYSCCEGVMGAPGCQVFKLHVHDAVSLDGFLSTLPRPASDVSCPGVYSVDCEMCYTTHGLELSRVTVVNSSLQVIYDAFVRPDNEVIDYNTRFSGVSEEDVRGTSTSIREVQQTLLSFISTDTVLIGHCLETNLCALKLLHGTVVDTSAVFPHRLGPPHKLTLNNLTADYLRRIIQESVCGHDTAEDAAACMELMLWKVKEDGKFKR
ncbi:RNA exonuclease 1 homolog [Centroberyx affinis]|uniref:RNA exonuclease 1 homolog n=1 Tax=Centroberyx affinis TaxID=166261 RepID=UPI003A5BBA53